MGWGVYGIVNLRSPQGARLLPQYFKWFNLFTWLNEWLSATVGVFQLVSINLNLPTYLLYLYLSTFNVVLNGGIITRHWQ